MNILFITASRIGDAVLSTGILDYLHGQYPRAHFTIVCGPLCTSLFAGFPGEKNIMALKKRSFNRHWIDLYRQLKARKWDMVVDLRNSAVSRLLPAKRKYIKTKRIDSNIHKVEQAAQLMNLNEIPGPTLWFTREQYLKALAMIPQGGKVLGVGPTANWIGKTWPAERFIDVIGALTVRDGILPDARVAVFAAPGEEEAACEVLRAVPKERQIDIIAKVDPGTAAACLARCHLYIGNDSGLMHCAAAAGTPTAGLFGPSYPHLYRPWGKHCTFAQTPETFDELTDFRGYDPKTLDHTLMNTLETDTVLESVEEFWLKRKNAA